jgi:hypothetical protein
MKRRRDGTASTPVEHETVAPIGTDAGLSSDATVGGLTLEATEDAEQSNKPPSHFAVDSSFLAQQAAEHGTHATLGTLDEDDTFQRAFHTAIEAANAARRHEEAVQLRSAGAASLTQAPDLHIILPSSRTHTVIEGSPVFGAYRSSNLSVVRPSMVTSPSGVRHTFVENDDSPKQIARSKYTE